jgi:SAM-dependent methyltransferase
MNWREYWNGPHPIYVNQRHHALHFQMIARDIAALFPSPEAVVLDYGCGEAWTAGDLAAKCARLYLFDTAPTVRAQITKRNEGNARIEVLDEVGLAALAPHSLDLIVVNSVLQYLSRQEFIDLLAMAKAKLKPDGALALGDVIPEDANALSDTLALLDFGRKGGFLLAALGGLVRTVFSDYRKLRDTLGLARYSEAGLLAILRENGFTGQRAAHNIGHNQGRMLFIAKPV